MALFDYGASFLEVRFPMVGGVLADNFLKVKETLTRIGAPAYAKDGGLPILWQSCLLLHKRQRFYVVSFKEMFLLDGKAALTHISDEDLARRNAIALLLEEWGLVELVEPSRAQTPPPADVRTIKIIPYRDKSLWQLKSKYEIGRKPLHKEYAD